MTIAMFACMTLITAVVSVWFELGDLAIGLLFIVGFFAVVWLSKRPEFQGLAPPDERPRS